MPFIVSKMASSVDYVTYAKGPNNKQVPQGRVRVQGGADVAAKKSLVTPHGVATQVTAAQLKQLRANPVFARHEAAGALKVLEKNPADADKVAADLARDESAPLTPGDYTSEGKTPPTTGAAQ